MNKLLAVMYLVFLVGFFVLPASSVYAQSSEAACEGAGGEWTGGQCEIGGDDPQKTVETVVTNGLNLISMVVGVAAVVMIMFAGFRYITAGGDSSKISSAQNSIIWAVVGLVVVAFAQVIVRYVLGSL